MTTTDPSRSSDGSESLWAYTHLPRGYTVRNRGANAVSAAVADTVARMEEVLYAHAPASPTGPSTGSSRVPPTWPP